MPHRGENKRNSTLRCTKTGGIQPKLNVACFVQSCLTDADFVIFSNYCLIGTRPRLSFSCLSIKRIYPIFQPPRGSAHKIDFASQSPENRGRVPRFSDPERAKSFCIGTFCRPCSAARSAVRTHLPEKRELFGNKRKDRPVSRAAFSTKSR